MNRRQRMIVQAWAGLDLILTALLVLPPVALAFIGLLLHVNDWLGGETTLEAFQGIPLMFVCTTGALGVVWALARLIRPRRWLGAMDAVARAWVGGVIAYFVFAEGVPGILLLFVLTEWAGALHQAVALSGGRRGSAPTA